MNDKTPQNPCSLATPATPPALTPAPIQTNTMISTMPNEMEPLTCDEQEMLWQHHTAPPSLLPLVLTLALTLQHLYHAIPSPFITSS